MSYLRRNNKGSKKGREEIDGSEPRIKGIYERDFEESYVLEKSKKIGKGSNVKPEKEYGTRD